MASMTVPTRSGVRSRLVSSVLRALLVFGLACNGQLTSTQSTSSSPQSTSIPAQTTSQEPPAWPTSNSCMDWTVVPVTTNGQTTLSSISCFRWTVVPVTLATTTLPPAVVTTDLTDQRISPDETSSSTPQPTQTSDSAEAHDPLRLYALPCGLGGLVSHGIFFIDLFIEALVNWPAPSHRFRFCIALVAIGGNLLTTCWAMVTCRASWQLVLVRLFTTIITRASC
ncbi:hypothetical protein K491DRAFT_220224 [Lophiostoma macrostomum CBS 122681]|uniref:Uncharacterized protein n=1 Tax=Lophiostoma macrostomum CBS 122681 TaxID=1314788 RepID=A0A6A6SN15_9PLEO|nr:hypothetical protein K491DRAFT_220224 [Lophiostoma macrostomum CBS 122681]